MRNQSRFSEHDMILVKLLCGILTAAFMITWFAASVEFLNDLSTPKQVAGTASAEFMFSPNCKGVDWTVTDVDGRVFLPFDANRDGVVNCDSDIETGR